MISLDTNAALALIIDERKVQRDKVNLLLSRNVCYISDLVFPELEYTLTKIYGFPRQHVASSIVAIISNPSIKCNTGLLIEALDQYMHRPALSFVDCCLAIEAGITKHSPLYTFDKKLANQSGGLAELIV